MTVAAFAPHRPARERPGFSLAEAAVALLLLVVVIVPIIDLFQMTSRQVVKSRNHLVAQQLAAALFEVYQVSGNTVTAALQGTGTLRCADFLTVASGRELLTRGSREIEDVLKFARFRMKVEVERGVDGKIGLDRIETTLEWEEGVHKLSRTFARIVNS